MHDQSLVRRERAVVAKTGAYFGNLAFEDHVSSQLSQREGVTTCNLILRRTCLSKNTQTRIQTGKTLSLLPNWPQLLSKFREHPPALFQWHINIISSFETKQRRSTGSLPLPTLPHYCNHQFRCTGHQKLVFWVFFFNKMTHLRYCKAASQGMPSTPSNGSHSTMAKTSPWRLQWCIIST